MERTINLFLMERKRERRKRFLRLSGMFLFAMVATSFGQLTDGGMQAQLTSIMKVIIPVIKYASSAI